MYKIMQGVFYFNCCIGNNPRLVVETAFGECAWLYFFLFQLSIEGEVLEAEY